MVAVSERTISKRQLVETGPRKFPLKGPLEGIVKLPQERKVNPFLLSVAAHELNHALVAFANNIPIDSVSCIKEGDSLGRTIIAGNPNIATFQMIAAAGSRATTEGKAEGHGSDMAKVFYMAHYHGGISVGAAQSGADSAIGQFSDVIRRKAAEMIADFGKVSGPLFAQILRHAAWEEAKEKFERYESYAFNPNSYEHQAEVQKAYSPLPNHANTTIIENYGTYSVVVRVDNKGNRKEEQKLCKICGQGDCEHIKKHDAQSNLRRAKRVKTFQDPQSYLH